MLSKICLTYILIIVFSILPSVSEAQTTAIYIDNAYFNDSYLYSGRMFDTISIEQLPQLKEFLKTQNVKGKVFFSGTGFTNVQVYFVDGNLVFMDVLFERIKSGSKITFEKCRLKRLDGTLVSKFGKSI